jgi:hypothetical protein
MTTNNGNSKGSGGSKGLASAVLLHRLQQLADGVAKHKDEEGFPSFFTHENVQAMHDRLAEVVVRAAGDRGRLKSLVLDAKPRLAVARQLYDRGVLAVISHYGPSSSTLLDFDLRPRRPAGSAHAQAARLHRRRVKARKQAVHNQAALAAKGGV